MEVLLTLYYIRYHAEHIKTIYKRIFTRKVQKMKITLVIGVMILITNISTLNHK